MTNEKDILEITKVQLKKGKHIFVFEKFDVKSKVQAYVRSATIYGLYLIAAAINSNDPVMIFESNLVFSIAFKNLVVCASNINNSAKENIGAMVRAMNGVYDSDLRVEQTTHLITNSTLTEKYIVAAKFNIPIYHLDWISKVLHATTSSAKLATLKAESQKYEHYILPPLFDLKIHTTGIPAEDRAKIRTEIEENGGIFEETFRKGINILIVGGTEKNDKTRAAKSLKIPCLIPSWIYDSIKAKHSLPYDDYIALRSSHSKSKSPKEQDVTMKLEEEEKEQENKNSERASTERIIKDDDDDMTICTQKTHESILDRELKANEKPKLVETLDENLTLTKAKKAGAIFDGICFNIFDFSFNDSKKLKKILMACGGWCRELDETVTHIVCFDPNSAQCLNDITKKVKENNWHPTIVKIEWIIECIDQRQLLPITKDYVVSDFSVKATPSNQENAGKIVPSKFISKNSKPLENSNGNKQTPNSAQKRKLSQVPPKKVKRAKVI